ncbi:28S ribosomal protein S29, mitochondrial [Chrysoperla carnea]|uniref:28S ribosomal protein S29, mitochondrial n=1 Tax=Chrysoperla carnea TaxID=189513 RepID=UPI001D07BF86|nr:28S ribosomal protein S29, mitochondrial [Chrysoperla carnea]
MLKLIKNLSKNNHVINYSTQAAILNENVSQVFRSSENSPTKQTSQNLGQFYEIDTNVKKKLFQQGGLPKSFEIQTKTFGECCLMVRNPALDIINCLKNLNFTKPTTRFVLYGKKGSGKSLTMAHVIHFASENNYLIVHVPWVANWMRKCKEYANSTTKEGYVDLPIDSATWLVHFRTQNAHLLSDLLTSNDYVWSKRESTPKGSKLIELVEHGINRIKFASDCIVAIAEEIKILSTQGKCKTLVAIDGFNAFFYPHTRVYTDAKVAVPPNKVRLTDAFLSLTQCDWSNGSIVVTVDEQAVPEKDHGSHYPFYLLGKSGFEHLDPFVPILVPEYTSKEFESCMKYYRDRLWVQTVGDPQTQNEELYFLSGLNPYRLMKICAPL